MRTRPSHREVEQHTSPAGLEHQQAVLLGALRAAHGQIVSYQTLREAGIEFPASVVSELELAGVEIERCREGAHAGAHVVGVRLRPLSQGSEPALHPATGKTPPSERRATGARLGWAAPVAGLAIVVVLIAGLALRGGSAPSSASAGHRNGRSAASGAARTRALAASPRSRHAARAAGAPTAATSHAATGHAPTGAIPVSSALAVELEAHGHGLLQAGQYGQAIPVLKSALAATGETLDACLQPSGETCLTYAYALYDLGRALLLSGQASAAVGVLERRLQIENQRSIVAAELESARGQAEVESAHR